MDEQNAQIGTIPPPPDGSGIVDANPSTAPSADSQPGDTQPGSIPPPPDGSAIVDAPKATTAQPDNSLLGSQALGNAATFVNKAGHRFYENTVKGAVDLAGQTVTRPIDYYHKAVDAARTGDWATAAEEASKLVNGGMTDKDHPLYKAAESIIMQPLKQIEAQYKENRAAGHGIVASATNVPNMVQGAKDIATNVSKDNAKNDQASTLADIVTPAMKSHAAGAIPVIGSAIQQLGSNLDEDLRAHDWGKVTGDVTAAAAQMATLGLGKVGEATEGIDKAPPGGTPEATPVDTSTSIPTGEPSSLTRAAQTVQDANATAATAPSAEGVSSTLASDVQQAHQPQLDANNQLNETANRNINAQHQTDTTQATAEQAQADFDSEQAKADVDKEAALAPGDEAITTAAKKAADESNKAMHDKYQAKSDELLDKTKGTTVDYEDSPIHKAAKELAGTVDKEGPLTKAVTKTLPGSPQANAILNNLQNILESDDEAEGATAIKDAQGKELTPEQHQELMAQHGHEPDPETEIQGTDMMDEPAQKPQVQMPDLMKMYKKIGENQRSTGWATSQDLADQNIYKTLKKAVNDTVQQIAEKSGNPEAVDIADQMNKDYRDEIRKFENPAVKALRSGKLSDVDAAMTGKQSTPGNIQAMKDALGSHWEDFRTNSLRRLVADTVNPDGSLNYKQVVSKINKLRPEVRTAMYGDGANSILDGLNRATKADDLSLEAGERIKAADAAREAGLKGVGQTVGGRSQAINKNISDIIGNGDITQLVKDPARRTALQEAVGPDGMAKLADMAIQQKIAEASGTMKAGKFVKGTGFNVDKFMDWYKEFADHPEAADSLFKSTPEATARYEKLMSNMQNAASVQKLVKNGVIPIALGGVGSAIAGPWGLLLGGLLRGGDAAQALKTGASAAEWLASHPNTWKGVELAGKAIDAAKNTKTGVKAGAKASTLRDTLGTVGQSLGGKPKKLTALTEPDDSTATSLPTEVQNATSTIPVKTVQGNAIADPNNRGGGVPIANVDQGAGNNTIEVNRPQDFKAPQQGHELTHVWQNNLPPSTQARIPADVAGTDAFDISDADKLRAQGKTLSDLPREKAATIVQKYIEDPKKNANLRPWISDMTRTALSSTMPTAPDATRLNMTPRPPGRPDVSVAGAYPELKKKK